MLGEIGDKRLPNIAKDQPVAKNAKDMRLIRSGGSAETVKSIAIDVEQSQAQQRAKQAGVARKRTKVTVAPENPLDQLLALQTGAQHR